jgi:hypothetical protein
MNQLVVITHSTRTGTLGALQWHCKGNESRYVTGGIATAAVPLLVVAIALPIRFWRAGLSQERAASEVVDSGGSLQNLHLAAHQAFDLISSKVFSTNVLLSSYPVFLIHPHHEPHSALQDPIQQLIIPRNEALGPATSAALIPPIRKVLLKRELKMTVIFDTIEPNLGVLVLWQPGPSFSMPYLDWDGLELGGLASHGSEGSSDVQCMPFDSAGFWKSSRHTL